MLLLTDILTPQRIKVPLSQTTKNGVICELVDLLAANGDIGDRDKVLQAVLDRERTRTTGIGAGLAIPHGKTPEAKKLVMAIGKPAQGLDFESVDGKPVTLIVLLVSPVDQTGPHIQALARISRLMSIDAFRREMESAATPEEMFRQIQDCEQQASA